MIPHRVALALAATFGAASSAHALDLNSFRARHKLPPLSVSAQLAGAAYSHAHDLAQRGRLDHNGFRARMAGISSTAAENVAYGCDDSACAFRMWARSAGHRRNMLLRGVTHYGLASATGANGRKYWVLELGN
jgi:uncharacterized protein YkwD